MRSKHAIFLVTGLAFATAAQASPPPEQALGSYANGSLIQADLLPWEGPGFVKLFRPRDRGWLARELLELLVDVSESVANNFPQGERLQIGDCSARDGGKITLHASHQNGLDVDLAFFRLDHREQDPTLVSGFDEVFVRDHALTPNFDLERNWLLVRELHRLGAINRIFVDAEIKRAFCRRAGENPGPETLEALRRLRPLEGHADHLHVRIWCPAGSPRCVAQEPPPEGSGCNEIPTPTELLPEMAQPIAPEQ